MAEAKGEGNGKEQSVFIMFVKIRPEFQCLKAEDQYANVYKNRAGIATFERI